MQIIFTQFNDIYFETDTKEMVGCTTTDLVRYLKGLHTNYERLVSRFIEPFLEKLEGLKEIDMDDYNTTVAFLEDIKSTYSQVEPYNIKEAFELENREFQALVFTSIDIPQMIENLGATRIKSDGIKVKHKQYNSEGEFLGYKDYHNVYETYEVNGEKLGLEEPVYAVKCWCTSTNKEHWLWIDEEHKEDPLSAIASTFVVHENVVPHITALKRQGDILLTELDEEVVPEGNKVSLSKEQYFSLLVAQS